RRYLLLRRSGEFDVDSYLLANPDVLAARINPLMHYVQYGRGESRTVAGCVKQPTAAAAPPEVSSSDALHHIPSPTSDIGSPGAEHRDDEAIVRSSGVFDEAFYLDQNTDVRDAGHDPVL